MGVVEMLVPVVPLAPHEAELPAGDLQVGLGPVAGVGAHRPPLALHQHLPTQKQSGHGTEDADLVMFHRRFFVASQWVIAIVY